MKDLGKFVAISLLVTEPVGLLEPYWNTIDQVTIVGTPMGTKGTSMEPSIFDKIRRPAPRSRSTRPRSRSSSTAASGATRCRRFTEAGADWIVPGSLMFGEDPAAMRQWLGSL